MGAQKRVFSKGFMLTLAHFHLRIAKLALNLFI